MQIGLLEPDRFDAAVIDKLQVLGPVKSYTGGDLRAFLEPVEALFVRLGYAIDAQLLSSAPRLRYLCSPTTGHNHIDEAALSERNIRLLSLRGERLFLETIRATPEHTFGLILSLLRRYHAAFQHVAAGGWDRDLFRGEELYGQRVGIIGLGRVGFRVASYCQAFGAHVSFCDPREVPADPDWQRRDTALDVIAESRIVVLCASYTAGMSPVVGSPEIAALAGRYFVNTARGELVDEEALLQALQARTLAGLATDVLSHETAGHQLARFNTLAQDQNVILTPHVGGATSTAMARTEDFIADKLFACVRSQKGNT